MQNILRLLLVSVAVASCSEHRADDVTVPQPSANASIAYLAVSSERPAPGSIVTISILLKGGAGVEALGSFTARVHLPHGTVFVAEQQGSEGMQAVRAAADTLFIAGAAANGYSSGSLFSFDVKVNEPANFAATRLEMLQATSVSFTDVGRTLATHRGLVARLER